MATSVYKFLSWANANHSGGQFGALYGTVQVHWNYEKTNKKINITGITYNDDMWWCVASNMKMGIVWSDGQEEIICPDQAYNCRWVSGQLYFQTEARGGGFKTVNGVLGVFDNAHAVSHTFSGTTGGFGVRFGSTLSTINLGNPASYRDLERTSGDDTSVTFSTPPNFNNASYTSSNPSLYRLKGGISGISWGEGWSSKSLVAKVKYTIDGSTKEYTAYSSSNPSTSAEFDINAATDTIPWDRVPDDETVTITWTATTDIGTATGNKTQYCMPQYDVFVIDPSINGGNPVASEMKVSTAAGRQPTQGVRRVWSITE